MRQIPIQIKAQATRATTGQTPGQTPVRSIKRSTPKIAVLGAAMLIASSTGFAAPDPALLDAPYLGLSAVLPAYEYDSLSTAIVRRRPGHPQETRRTDQNTGHVDPAPVDAVGAILPLPDRWRMMESFGLKDNIWDPYAQNTLKGDKPIRKQTGAVGEDWFLQIIGISDTIIEPRSIPTPVGPQATANAGANDIFAGSEQIIFAQTFLAGIVYYQGNTVFKPPDWEYRLTLAGQYNRVDIDDVRGLQIDPRKGKTRDDGFIAVQEIFIDKHLRDVSTRYDFDAIRVGIQPFSSDFRGFLFQDLQFGVRLFGNRDNNFKQYNLMYFRRLEKDTNSGLNDVGAGFRNDDILLANYYWQDLGILGFTSQVIFAYNRNRDDDIFFDENGFITRPASLGTERPREYDVYYVGYNGDGHMGGINLSVSAYGAFGKNEGAFTGRDSDIRAGFFAAEVSKDYDWIRVRGSALYASGDKDPYDDRSTGYDAIFENPIFAGADTSYWIRQNVPLIGGGGVGISGRNGVLASLRPSKEQGQSNFDNPGIHLLGIGADFDLTPESRVSFNINQLWFDNTIVMETLRNQGPIARNIGTDASIAWIWRPRFHQNIVWRLSAAALEPGSGLANLYGNDDTYYTVLGNLILSY